MKPGLQLHLNQQLVLTPQLQQAIRLLQLSHMDLEVELRQIAEANPLIELESDLDQEDAKVEDPLETETEPVIEIDALDDPGERFEEDLDFSRGSGSGSSHLDEDSMESQDVAPQGRWEHLLWQITLLRLSPRDRQIAETIIDALDEDGYLHEGIDTILATLAALSLDPEEIEAVRRRLQQLDPIGIASLDLCDCLCAQLSAMPENTPQRVLAQRIVTTNIEALAKRDYTRLARQLRVDREAIALAAVLIRTLDPKPGENLAATPTEYVQPDAYVRRIKGRWCVRLSSSNRPRVGLNQHYCSLIAKASRDDASYLKGQLQEARWLLKSLDARANTLQRVAETIVRQQSAFLDFGPEAMRPLVLREVAEELDMHESTISRVTTRKYLHTPRGTFDFKYFFSSGVATEDGGSASATAVQALIRKLVSDEDPCQPLSDQALARELGQLGIRVARRTVAKYREALRILCSNERQRAR
ncbi:MAG TPA: RNA polymerase factor sigma-54 [Mizugakiibacter sp.]|nr:RNA polymerase factor sigma-54 [Mizugakiibacter sp.]